MENIYPYILLHNNYRNFLEWGVHTNAHISAHTNQHTRFGADTSAHMSAHTSFGAHASPHTSLGAYTNAHTSAHMCTFCPIWQLYSSSLLEGMKGEMAFLMSCSIFTCYCWKTGLNLVFQPTL